MCELPRFNFFGTWFDGQRSRCPPATSLHSLSRSFVLDWLQPFLRPLHLHLSVLDFLVFAS
ncbi:hypothetical protein BGZ60DRAFT_115402 [Tricladium varicosporioides]|nr:hypothetical protein BGZ60DRAFT_115402 [Hymenoscyphus varicosporioides]